MRIDIDGESIAVSKKTHDEDINVLNEAYSNTINDFNKNWFKKADIEHKHSIADITDLQTVLDKKLEETDISELNTKVNANTKSISDISTTLGNKADKTDVALKTDLNLKADVTTLNSKADKTDLNKKSDVGHTHSISDVSNLQTTLNGKASKSHTHSISDVSNLQSTLNSKASTSHSHSISDISNLQYTLNNKASASDLSSLEAKINNLSNDSVRNKNGGSLSFWAGTQYQYDNIYYKDDNTIYFITE